MMRGLLATLVLLSLLHAVRGADDIRPTDKYVPLAKHVSDIIRTELESKQIPCFSIAVVDDDQIVSAQGFGFADSERTKPATARTVYRVGSVSKLLTDLAIMRCVEQGLVDLDAPVTSYDEAFGPRIRLANPSPCGNSRLTRQGSCANLRWAITSTQRSRACGKPCEA